MTDAEQVPVSGALVRVEPPGHQIAASTDDKFAFSALPLSRVTVTVVAKGFFSGFRTEIDLSENAAAEAQILLRREAVLEQSIVVTGSGTQALVMEAPVRTELLSQSFVQAQAARNLAEALTATVPGVRIENNCQNCGWTAVRLNGLEGPYTQILEDGLPTVSGASMVYALDQLPTEFFENIEVVKGGASSLYGPNAVAGVINLVRREPQEKRLHLDLQSGGYAGRPEHTGGLIAQLDQLGDRWSADVYYRGLRRTHTDLDRDGFTKLTRRASNGGGGTAFGRFLEGRARLTAGAAPILTFHRRRRPLQSRCIVPAPRSSLGGTIRQTRSFTTT